MHDIEPEDNNPEEAFAPERDKHGAVAPKSYKFIRDVFWIGCEYALHKNKAMRT